MSRKATLSVKKTQTRFGTPLSPGWDEGWSQKVEALEVKLSRRICGGRTLDGGVCLLFSNHASGRCRYHGGLDGTGGQSENRNALLHGLFSRRLQDCGVHCPRFERCPFAGTDVAELPATSRPACPYETAEYDVSVEDLSSRGERVAPGDDYAGQLAHHVALLQVMVGRAARAMASGNEQADLNAYLRLSAEYRRALRMMTPVTARGKAGVAVEESQPMGLADQLLPLLKATDGVLQDALDYERRRLSGQLTAEEIEEEKEWDEAEL